MAEIDTRDDLSKFESMKWVRNQSQFIEELPEELHKREKRQRDIEQLLQNTKKFYQELNSRLRNVKDYMDQELETGIFTFEMYLLKELEKKQLELTALNHSLQKREAALDRDSEIQLLRREIQWYGFREKILGEKASKFGNNIISYTRLVLQHRSTVKSGRTEVWKLQQENTRLEQEIKALGKRRETGSVSVSPTEEVLQALPPLTLLMELSPKSLGSLRLRELQEYKTFKAKLTTLRIKLSRTQQKTSALISSQVDSIQPQEGLKRLFLTCFNCELHHVFELSTPQLRTYLSSPTPGLESPAPRKVISLDRFKTLSPYHIIGLLAVRPDVTERLKETLSRVRGGKDIEILKATHGRIRSQDTVSATPLMYPRIT